MAAFSFTVAVFYLHEGGVWQLSVTMTPFSYTVAMFSFTMLAFSFTMAMF